VRFVVLLSLLPALAAAQQPANRTWSEVTSAMAGAAERQRAAVQQAMGQSIERQRQSVRTQARGAVAENVAAAEAFTIPWPASMAPPSPVVTDCDPLPPPVIDALVDDSARRETLAPDLLREVMRRESQFHNCAVSSAGAQGLMQLMPATARQFHVRDSFDPKQNVAAGAKFLKSLIDRYGGDLTLALGAYNAGPARVDEAGGVPAIPETQDYVTSILGALPLP
jgi:soluble lytic murein transglycosylase-like protein